jgi:hypothetical protein
MKGKKIISLIVLLLTAALPALAQKFTASVSKAKIAVGENFQLTFSLNTGGSAFKAPPLSDFVVYMGPSQSTSMQIINGNVSQSISFTYLLAPKKEGKFTIGPASITVNGNKIESNAITIEVKGNYNPGQQQNARQNPRYQDEQASPPTENLSDNLFVRTVVSKKQAYLGEQITVTHKVYTRLNLKGFKDIKFPAYNGFWAQDVPQQQNITPVIENIDGVSYNVAELKRTYLFAQRTGKLELAPMEVECVVRERASGGGGNNDFWNDPFWPFENYKDVVYKVKSKPVSIEVVALPEEGKPADFSGAVGEYSFKASIDKEKLVANEAVTLNMTIHGKGNIKLIEPVKINFPEEFETYEPKTDDNISLNASGVSGSKSFDYLLIPRSPGKYTIGGASFSYFDPAKQTYITLPSPEFTINVEKGDNSGPQVTNPRVPKEDVKVLNNDIRYIKTGEIMLTEKKHYFFGSPAFIAGMTAPALAFFMFLFLRKRHIERNSDIVQVKSRKATGMAKKRLAIAEKHKQSNNKELFYEEIFRALYGYLSDKLNIPYAQLSRDAISSVLLQRSVRTETISKLMTTLDTCEFARYAPSAVSGDLDAVYKDSVDTITTIEEEIK